MASLLKSQLDNSIADAVFNEIQNRSARYYYFLGKTLRWNDELNPPYPIDSFDYELQTRNEIITLKEINSTDVAYVIPRRDWVTGQVWDMYDDQYSQEVQGINLISGGYGYSSNPAITITGGGGTGAAATAVLTDGVITEINITSRGTGYTSIPTVTISGGGGANAIAEAVVTIAPSGAQRLEDTNCYVLTDDFNVYKCLDNNNNAISTYKPIGTVVDPVIMPDGYMWKYLYSIPIALRNKFLTDVYMPVVNSIRSQFYSGGEILNVKIDNAGQNYTFANISVAGDGYRASDPLLLKTLTISNPGSGYTSGATLTIDPPFNGANEWQDGVGILLGQKVEYQNNLYEASVSGTLASPGPSHLTGIVANGTAALKYIGTRATGVLNIVDDEVADYALLGSVYEITVTNGGLGYTSAPTVSLVDTDPDGSGENWWDIDGTGFIGQAVMNGTSVSKIQVMNPGSGYGYAQSLVLGTKWTASTAVTVGQQLFYSNRLYTVTAAGTTSTSAPVIAGAIATIPVTSGGSGYSAGTLSVYVGPPDVPGGNQAVATAVLTSGVITSITVSSGGTGYINPPIVRIVGGGGTGAVLGTPILQTTSNGTATLKYAGVAATGEVVLRYGAGYSSLPTATITPVSAGSGATAYFVGVKSEAKILPLIEDGQVTSVQIDDGGIGYTYANLSVSGDGDQCYLSADLSPGDINTLQANTELLTPDGRIMAYPVISGGYGYGSDFEVTIEGDGTGAAAIARVQGGSIKKIEVTNYGLGYRWCKVSFDKSNGFGAKARGIMAPYGGHGKDPITGMFTRTLMFYTNVSKDANQGFQVNNDYRQLGIIKNPRKFGEYGNLASSLASACYVITAYIDINNFTPDMNLTLGSSTGPRFRIVALTTTGALIQSLDNSVPLVGSVFLNAAGNTFSASGVTAPTADKYSGHMLFIDNKEAFTPTGDQNVTLRTVVHF
jgi:hypothetical protein